MDQTPLDDEILDRQKNGDAGWMFVKMKTLESSLVRSFSEGAFDRVGLYWRDEQTYKYLLSSPLYGIHLLQDGHPVSLSPSVDDRLVCLLDMENIQCIHLFPFYGFQEDRQALIDAYRFDLIACSRTCSLLDFIQSPFSVETLFPLVEKAEIASSPIVWVDRQDKYAPFRELNLMDTDNVLESLADLLVREHIEIRGSGCLFCKTLLPSLRAHLENHKIPASFLEMWTHRAWNGSFYYISNETKSSLQTFFQSIKERKPLRLSLLKGILDHLGIEDASQPVSFLAAILDDRNKDEAVRLNGFHSVPIETPHLAFLAVEELSALYDQICLPSLLADARYDALREKVRCELNKKSEDKKIYLSI